MATARKAAAETTDIRESCRFGGRRESNEFGWGAARGPVIIYKHVFTYVCVCVCVCLDIRSCFPPWVWVSQFKVPAVVIFPGLLYSTSYLASFQACYRNITSPCTSRQGTLKPLPTKKSCVLPELYVSGRAPAQPTSRTKSGRALCVTVTQASRVSNLRVPMRHFCG